MDLAVEMKEITKVFNKAAANDKVNFQLKKGSIHGLLGENGAGKTTLMNCLYGLYQPESGNILIDGQNVKIDSPQKAMSLGIGMVHQHFMLVRPMTVAENVMLGLRSQRGPLLDSERIAQELLALSQKFNLNVNPKAKISQLSIGEQQRAEILSALYRGAEILILDEPTAVLTPKEAEELFEILRMMRDNGKSVILISHKLEEILALVDEVTVLRDGRSVSHTKVTPATTKRELTNMMVGRDVLFNFNYQQSQLGEIKLVIEHLEADNDKGLPALKNVSFSLKAGEVLGIAGVDGNGQRELCEVLTGLRASTSGEVLLKGQDLSQAPPKAFINAGIAHIPEDRHKTGLAMNMSISKNLIIKNFHQAHFASRGLLKFKAIREHAQRLMEEYDIKANSINTKVKELSGGNQQKVILARELSSKPEVIIANQPTRGLDIGATEYVRQKLLEETAKGAGLLLISADLEEILQLSDRIAVMYDGEIIGILGKNADVDEIGLLMAGVRREGGKAC